jgi:hypothetical protein
MDASASVVGKMRHREREVRHPREGPELCELNGGDFASDETICIRVTEDNPDFRWVRNDSIAVDGNGDFTYPFRISPDFIAQYRVRVWGLASGNYAEMTPTRTPSP